MSAKEVVVVPHTHWDREWYRTYQEFRLKLVETVDRVVELLEENRIPYFLLDGQTIMLTDYLAIKPERREVLERLIREGRLGIGPWYILPDEFLVSGEALIRNLLMGRRLMTRFGQAEAVGYLPDMFGHVAQIPQILLGFGMEQAVLWRGVDPETERFWWRAPSGQRVQTTFLPTGYCNIFLWERLSLERRLEAFKTFLSEHRHERILLLSGCDHIAPNADLPAIIDAIQAQWSEGTIRLGKVREALEANGAMPAEEITGELRQGGRAYLLPDVLSARMYLKQLNAECQTLWQNYVEPLTALSWASGGRYEDGFWQEGWDLLLQNQPHDSICGCSVDEVHQEMLARFSQVKELGETLIKRSLFALAPAGAEPGVMAYNPTGWERSEWIDVTIDWKLEGAPETAHLVDENGKPVPCFLEAVEDGESFYSDIYLFPGWYKVRKFKMRFLASDLPAFGVKRYFLREGAPHEQEVTLAAVASVIENDHLRVGVRDGKVVMEDRDTGAFYGDLIRFIDEGDAGDEYNYSPPTQDRVVESRLINWWTERPRPTEAVLVLEHLMNLPESLSDDREARSQTTVLTKIKTRLTLRPGMRVVEAETTFDNQVRDHRLRVLCGTALKQNIRVWSENQFWVAERPPTTRGHQLPVEPLKEYVATTFPQQTWSAVEGDWGLMVSNVGLPEAEVVQAEDGSWALAITLLRAVGWLSRDDLRTRGGGAGPHFPTPEAQCLGEQRFRYAFAPYRDHWMSAQPHAYAAVTPIRTMGFGGEQAVLAGDLKMQADWLRIDDERLVVSAVKRSEGGDGVIVRLYNPTERAIETTLAVGLPHEGIALATMADEPIRELGVSPLALPVGTGEIVTLLIRMKPEGKL